MGKKICPPLLLLQIISVWQQEAKSLSSYLTVGCCWGKGIGSFHLYLGLPRTGRCWQTHPCGSAKVSDGCDGRGWAAWRERLKEKWGKMIMESFKVEVKGKNMKYEWRGQCSCPQIILKEVLLSYLLCVLLGIIKMEGGRWVYPPQRVATRVKNFSGNDLSP